MANQLTQKQEMFCVKYFELGNASEAARIAGYSPKWAGVNTCQILRRPSIQARIEELREKEDQARQKIEMESVMSVLERKQRLTEIGRARPTKVKLHNSLQAIDLLNKMEKLYSDGSPVNIDNRVLFVIGKGYADDKPDIQSDKQDAKRLC